MKKAKMMLMAVAVVGIAGGAVALKAQKFGSVTHLGASCVVVGQQKECSDDIAFVNYTTIPNENPVPEASLAKTGQLCTTNDDCTIGTTIYQTAD